MPDKMTRWDIEETIEKMSFQIPGLAEPLSLMEACCCAPVSYAKELVADAGCEFCHGRGVVPTRAGQAIRLLMQMTDGHAATEPAGAAKELTVQLAILRSALKAGRWDVLKRGLDMLYRRLRSIELMPTQISSILTATQLLITVV